LLSEVFRFIKASFNKRLVLYFFVVTCFTTFGSIPIATLKLPFLFAFLPASFLLLIIVSKNFICPNFKFATQYRKGQTIPVPKQFQDMARRMGTSLKEIKIIDSDKKNAFATRGGIAFTRKLMEELTKDEMMAVAAHEITHKKEHHIPFLTLAIMIPLIAAVFSWSRFTAPIIFNDAFTGIMFRSMLELALLAFMMMIMIPASWILELRADKGAAKFAGKRNMQSALLKLSSPETINQRSETHPSVQERIRYIEDLKF
jgi:Zn-dependent protease with chaperone function